MATDTFSKQLRILVCIVALVMTSCFGGEEEPTDGGSTAPAPTPAPTVYTLSYPTALSWYEMDTAITDVPVSTNYTGGLSKFTVSPNLPGGLFVDPDTGKITGTPVGEWIPEDFTITATRADGELLSGKVKFGVHQLGMTEIPANATNPMNFTYDQVVIEGYENEPIVPITPRYVGDPSTVGFQTFDSLPYPMDRDFTTGVISGAPQYAGNYTYRIGVKDTSSPVANDVVIKFIIKVPPIVNYRYSSTNFVFPRNSYISEWAETDRGSPTTFSISPALPSGITFSTTNGSITGSSMNIVAGQEYTVTVSNSVSTTTTKFNLAIADSAPSGLTYTKNSPRYLRNAAIETNTPKLDIGSGAASSYSVSPALPAGLSLNTTTGVITGTPTTLQAAANYTVTASNGTGNSQRTLSIAVVGQGSGALFTADGIEIKSYNVDDVNGDPTYTGKSLTSTVKSKLVFHPTHDCMVGYSGGSVESFSVDKADGAELTSVTSVGGVSSPGGIVQSSNGNYVFVANSGFVSSYSIDNTCALTFIAAVSAGGSPTGMAIHGTNIYVANGNGVQHFKHDGSGGLTLTSSAGTGPGMTLAMHPDGTYLYTSHSRTVQTIATNPTTGAVTTMTSKYYQDWFYIRQGWFIGGFFIHPMQSGTYGDGLVSHKMVTAGLDDAHYLYQSEVGQGYAGAWEATAHTSPSGTYIYANYKANARWGARRLKLDMTTGQMTPIDAVPMNVIGGY